MYACAPYPLTQGLLQEVGVQAACPFQLPSLVWACSSLPAPGAPRTHMEAACRPQATAEASQQHVHRLPASQYLLQLQRCLCAMHHFGHSYICLNFLHLQAMAEAAQQVRRLAGHASVALWGGSNEGEDSLEWYPESRANRGLYATGLHQLFVEELGRALAQARA